MFARVSASLLVAALTGLVVVPAAADGPADNLPDNVRPVPPKGDAVPDGVQAEIRKGLGELQELIKAAGDHPLLPDVLVYEKAVRWALDYNEVFDPKPAKGKTAPPPAGAVKKVLAAGLERAKQLKDGKTPWATQTGPVLRGYRSKIDGSVQPYWLIVPADYVAAAMARHRLDFWWHGRGELLSEANFMAGSPGTGGINPVPGQFILHPYGRYCNANKFAGEVDTFECLEHARKHYRIDDSRLVARGFSMGGAACWQFAVHYPTLWSANAPGAGFSETPEFLRVFQKEETKDVPWYEQKLWHLYNATDYAQNIFNLPTVAYSGEIDSQKQAADVMAREMKKVGLELDHVIGPKTGHSYEKGAKEVVNKKIDAIVAKGLSKTRDEIKFVTYTLRYNQAGPIAVEGLEKHWEPATINLKVESKSGYKITTSGVTSFSLKFSPSALFEIDGKFVAGVTSIAQPPAVLTYKFVKTGTGWKSLGDTPPTPVGLAKKPGLQGPIDDAFLDRFVMVRPTGKALNEKVGAWADAEMKHAVAHWRKHFRGDAPVTDDKSVTDEQIKNANLVLWGDPSSNAVLAKIADQLPVKWTSEGVTVGDKMYPAGTHVPVLIYPNPLNPAKYVVLNSGFTFREYAYLNNARQVPMLPDYAVVDITTPPNSRHPGNVVRAGFFGERWELLPNDGR
ncbi:prolyl oligopeptidase family serine peptidase [bacterium]|nr:prolyl oligopeptidase family serine peptidase [bacterium]